jgi:hypothetical protein
MSERVLKMLASAEVLRGRADGDEVDERGMRGSSDFADVFLHLCV